MLEPSKNRATDEKFKKIRTGLEKKLICGMIVVVVIAAVFVILYYTKKSCSASEQECTDKRCIRASALLLDFVDLKRDPCGNFYEYVCGHYIKNAVKKDTATPILQIQTEFKNELKAIIVDPVKKKDGKANVAMKMFYQACMNESGIEKDGDKTFFNDIDSLGGWPLLKGSEWNSDGFDWMDWYHKAVKIGLPIIGLIKFEQMSYLNNLTVLKISGAALDNKTPTPTAFVNVMDQIAKEFKAPAGFGSDNIEVAEFLKNVRRLSRQIVPEEFLDYEDDYLDLSTIEDLYELCPQFPWLKIINTLSGNIREFTNSSQVAFGNIRIYCIELDDLLKITPHRVIANYYIWSIIYNSHQFMSNKIRDAFESIKNEVDDRFEFCFNHTDEKFQYLKETVYIRKKTNPSVREQLNEMIELIKETYIEHIKESTWMDEETKTRAMEKTNLIEKVVGADDILYDTEKFDRFLGVDDLEFTTDNPYEVVKQKMLKENSHLWETLYEETEDWKTFFNVVNQVNAFFAFALNVMIIPAPILNSIFFNPKFPSYMNYGSIGRVIGHEIMHGFGEVGRKVILKNNKVVDWWTNATAEAFNTTKQCVIEEYESMHFERYQLNGKLTLEENICDIVGVDVAYEAYLKWIKKYGEEEKLPGIPLTPKQLFWLQTGTSLCFRKLDDEEMDLERENEHAIPAYRVAAGARNSKYFANDFNCPVGSFMNQKEKCRIL